MSNAAQSPPLTKAAGRWRIAVLATIAVCIMLAGGWFGWSAWRSSQLRVQARDAIDRADWDRAEDRLTRLVWYHPTDAEALNLRIGVALSRGEPALAATLLSTVPESDSRALEARITAGRLWLQAFHPREAEAAFRAALRLRPDSDAARLALIAILAIQGRAADYEAEAWALHDHGVEPIKALRLLAQAAPAIPPDTLARTADDGTVLRLAFDADPDDAYTRIALARFERARGKTEIARGLLEPLRGVASVPPESQVEWAACLLDDNDTDHLEAFFSEAPGPLDRMAGYWMLRGEWADRNGQADEAVSCFRTAVDRDPRDPAAHYRLGRALRAVGRQDEAVAEMDVARQAQELKDLVAKISDSSRNADLLSRASQICAAIGRDREANAWLALAQRADPDRFRLAAESRQGDAQRAAKLEPLSERKSGSQGVAPGAILGDE